MSKCDDDRVSNPNNSNHFDQVLETFLTRRKVLKGGLAGMTVAFFGLPLAGCGGGGDDDDEPETPPALLGFTSILSSTEDTVRVPPGYSYTLIAKWGDPVGHAGQRAGEPAYQPDASNTAEEQALQVGMHNDGMHFFSLPRGSDSSDHGLLVMNHEYADDGLLHVGGIDVAATAPDSTLPAGFVSPTGWTLEKVRKCQNAHGVSILEIRKENNQWRIEAPSTFARRITGNTPITISGPAAGAPLMRTAADPAGRQVLGTLNNCAHGYTPWGTYLTCEENWNGYFVNPTSDVVGVPDIDQKQNILSGQSRYGITKDGFGYRWHEHDARFDASQNPNEPNRFGWVTEIDPFTPDSTPVKRTALGRIKHESATLSLAADNRVVLYTGDDERNEYIYKFVSRDAYDPANRDANRDLLDHGTLYVARFNGDGTCQWLPLVHGQGGLTPENGFTDQAEVLIKTRQAADRIGATVMDRPEWIAVHPRTKEVYATLTNNSRRGTDPATPNNPDGTTSAGGGRPPVDPANPRARNTHGHIIRWRETGDDPTATAFTWDIFVLAGDPTSTVVTNQGNIVGDIFSAPDGLWFDQRGVLWIETDVSTSNLYHPTLAPGNTEFRNVSNNQLLAADSATREIRRFLTGPIGCEVTGIVSTPDGRTMFVNIQHPGEPLSPDQDDNAADNPTRFSTWPDGGRPRSATVVITKDDGGVIGT